MKKLLVGLLSALMISTSIVPTFALTDTSLLTPTLTQVNVVPSTAFDAESNLINFSGTIKNNTDFKATIKSFTINALVEFEGQTYSKELIFEGGQEMTVNSSPPTTTKMAKTINKKTTARFFLYDQKSQSMIPPNVILDDEHIGKTTLSIEYVINAKVKKATPLKKSIKSKKVLKKLKKNTKVEVLSKTTKKYVKVKVGKKTGYVLANRLKQ